jgi:hypothetical protein
MFLLVKTVIEHSGYDLLNQGLCRQQIVEIFYESYTMHI